MTARDAATVILVRHGGWTHRELEAHLQQVLDEEVGRELDARAEANAQMIRDAVAAERERCAGIAEDAPHVVAPREWIAQHIREG